jgi:hypothetical protein
MWQGVKCSRVIQAGKHGAGEVGDNSRPYPDPRIPFPLGPDMLNEVKSIPAWRGSEGARMAGHSTRRLARRWGRGWPVRSRGGRPCGEGVGMAGKVAGIVQGGWPADEGEGTAGGTRMTSSLCDFMCRAYAYPATAGLDGIRLDGQLASFFLHTWMGCCWVEIYGPKLHMAIISGP